ncbi:MAG TPA: FAD-dependent oxidoreductase [Anaeromyxobacter sp.]|nr:FAD-dependent oxidoreductase [Anaeromyxobacter sp.]
MTADVIVVGAGISGLSLAWRAAREGRKVVVLERGARIGGCFHSHRTPDGFWFEMGAHTTYNSYGSFLDVVVGSDLAGRIVERGPARATFGLLRDGEVDWLTPYKVLARLSWLEAAVHFPLGILRRKEGETVYSYYAHLVGRRNYDRLLSAFFAAVPSQKADGFPVEGPGSLFKKRARRKEFPRSFGIQGGLQTVCEAAAKVPGVAVETGVAVKAVAPRGGGFAVTTSDGRTLEAPRVAVAAPPDAAAAVLRDGFHEVSSAIARVSTVTVETVGVVLPRKKCWMRECAFVVPVDDVFYSCVTRDAFPDPERRGFAFHFRPGVSREDKLRRVAEVLRVSREDLGTPVEERRTLPAPALGHAEIVREVDACLAGGRLAVTGNYFAGLAIEDCVGRSFAEWARIAG